MLSAEIFAGCGALALGISQAGFDHAIVVEREPNAVETLARNRDRGVGLAGTWPVLAADVRSVDWRLYRSLDLISGGPPCQPFAIGGKKRGRDDPRDMWPEAIRAIRDARPRAFLFENVRNLAGPRFASYLAHLLDCLRNPNVVPDTRPSSRSTPIYDVTYQVVNAADFGAPQIRYRVLIFGVVTGMGLAPEPMRPTHSRDALLWNQYVRGDYWRRHDLPPRSEPEDERDRARVAALRGFDLPPSGRPWVTLRDALAGLGEPLARGERAHPRRALDDHLQHWAQPGARSYKGHTGSLLDLPAKALKAGDHGVPGGENMIRLDNGKVRYVSLREAARLVGLPDDYVFPGSWTESMRQLGNAVPVQVAEAAARHLRRHLMADVGARAAA